MTKLLAVVLCTFLLTSFYDLSFTDIDGKKQTFSLFKGKKVLIVNTASSSIYTPQYAQLEQLHQKYKNNLVIVAFPTNGFNHEGGNNDSIKHFLIKNFSIHFLVASKGELTGGQQLSFYKWLTKIGENGLKDRKLKDDFDKYLFNEQGILIGHFHPALNPMDKLITNAIEGL